MPAFWRPFFWIAAEVVLLLLITTPRGKEGGMPRDFGGARSLLLLPLRAVAAAPCAARPVAGGLDGDQERESWSTLQHLGLLEEEVGAPTRWYLLLSFVSCVVLLPHLPESKTEPGCN